ncbi:signal recognition particle subunit FFH/SRP54 (srp54) [Chthonomonas calidirosea]|uniref:Signal recognition particle protein n=1 Tax=Chthonomonas calidirosea (strain DSM 23976 / ICMP 18418 / T49) TaxID=1303518 RepID=S0F041_CHTCT|nr:signal recognition particle protein [Chthonomonas calidirosea]CCW36462.1 signal recognition particle subunit FFH/SRP54 (srp54) [Chthonomonas calidirosea T49]CEK16179.1 signal recognition particle subunit FFH/SRP54 (srp54) [Chthonomonas calidirosea]CEK17266.1 signal recognition particle subunit FFH/SRP54 (srp54) [Chthonomonas calidirosea]
MFDSLSEKLQNVFMRLRGKGRVTEADVNEAVREVRLALLEADVSLPVVRDFIGRIREKALGVEVLESLQPWQQVIDIVYKEMVALLGQQQAPLNVASTPPTIVMLCGLQGTGKTTLAAKLGTFLKKQGHRPLLVACDIYRPAAIKQLQVLGEQAELPVYALPEDQRKGPPTIARMAVEYARQHANDFVILDTAGRLAIDDELMDELGQMRAFVQPHEVILVVDAMVGQDAVNFAEQFHKRLALTGFVMTKLDGDTRGGAALSIRAVTGVPIKFIGTGEKLDAFEPFYPDRMAQRILGMGDILSLIEKAQEAVDEKKAAALEAKLRENRFDFNDLLEQLEQMKKLGPIENLLKLIPGVNNKMLEGMNLDPKVVERRKAIILSMTPQERANPTIINASRRRRIAAGCGQSVHEVNQLLNDFERMRRMMRTLIQQVPGAKPNNKLPSARKLPGALKKMSRGQSKGWFSRQ